MATLENNYNQFPANQGAVREGPTLFQGMVWCKRCGHKMRICYQHGQPYYLCDGEHRKFGTAVCTHASACRVDVLVEELFLSLTNVATLESSASYDQKLQEEAKLIDRQWQEKLQRLSYQADLARRRYEAVDPANRLVAATLETEWNERLVELEEVRQAHQAQRPSEQELQSTMTQMREVLTHLRDYWYQDSVTNQEKKDLLRCVIERVTLEKQANDKVIRAEICWQGGPPAP